MKDHVVVMFLQIEVIQKVVNTSELRKKKWSSEPAGLQK